MLIHLNKNNIHIVFYFYCNMWDRVPTFKKNKFHKVPQKSTKRQK